MSHLLLRLPDLFNYHDYGICQEVCVAVFPHVYVCITAVWWPSPVAAVDDSMLSFLNQSIIKTKPHPFTVGQRPLQCGLFVPFSLYSLLLSSLYFVQCVSAQFCVSAAPKAPNSLQCKQHTHTSELQQGQIKMYSLKLQHNPLSVENVLLKCKSPSPSSRAVIWGHWTVSVRVNVQRGGHY